MVVVGTLLAAPAFKGVADEMGTRRAKDAREARRKWVKSDAGRERLERQTREKSSLR
jgi:hypothetical protein